MFRTTLYSPLINVMFPLMKHKFRKYQSIQLITEIRSTYNLIDGKFTGLIGQGKHCESVINLV